MVKVALVEPSSSTDTCLLSALSWVNNYFFLVGAASLAWETSVPVGSDAAAALRVILWPAEPPWYLQLW